MAGFVVALRVPLISRALVLAAPIEEPSSNGREVLGHSLSKEVAGTIASPSTSCAHSRQVR